MPNNFGLTRQTTTTAAVGDRIDRIAREFGAVFYQCSIPGNPVRGFFEGPNLGRPFDDRLRDRVLAAVREREPAAARLLGY